MTTELAPSRHKPLTKAPLIVYFSSVTENTHRFVTKLGLPAARIPIRATDPPLQVETAFVLITPTYGGGGRNAVPKQVVRFLNDEQNRALLTGVIGAGNTNFGETYCLASKVIAQKCGVPLLYNFELMGDAEDVLRVREGLEQPW